MAAALTATGPKGGPGAPARGRPGAGAARSEYSTDIILTLWPTARRGSVRALRFNFKTVVTPFYLYCNIYSARRNGPISFAED